MAGIYLHIPFCKTRCIYCDFYSTTHSEWRSRYIQTLCCELEMRSEYLKREPVETIYLGGGTPSQLTEEDFMLIFDTIERNFGMEHCCEITLEANPDDLTIDYLQMLAKLPFNRISMGIQTFNDTILRLLKRRHNATQAIEAVQRCREVGFQNISIDLIYGLPGETIESWENDLQQTLNLNVEHISAYHLIYEEGTPIYNMLQKHQINEIDENTSVQFFSLLIKRLSESGYEHYEISNFCKSEKYAQHNTSYWKGIPYLGCGPSAHSYNLSAREWNISSIESYMKGVEEGKRPFETEMLDPITRYNEFIITSLRTMWGIPLKRMKDEFGMERWQYCMKLAAPYLENKKLEIKDDALCLTKEGIFISDSIMSDLLFVEE